MKKIFWIVITILTLNNLKINAQEALNDTIVSVKLDEVIVSTPFNESLENNVIKVNKINLGNLSLQKRQSIPKVLDGLQGISFITTGPGIQKPSIRGLNGVPSLRIEIVPYLRPDATKSFKTKSNLNLSDDPQAVANLRQ